MSALAATPAGLPFVLLNNKKHARAPHIKGHEALWPRVQVDINVSPGGHASEAAVNKQLNDKERVAAALENPNLAGMVDRCLSGTAMPM